jgi:hypothetical protein
MADQNFHELVVLGLGMLVFLGAYIAVKVRG